MTEEINTRPENMELSPGGTIPVAPPPRFKAKRDIFRFDGEKPTGINLDHVTVMCIEGNKITFTFHTNSISAELDTEDAAKTAFENLLTVWAAPYVVE